MIRYGRSLSICTVSAFHLHSVEADRATALAAREELFQIIHEAAASGFEPTSGVGKLPGAITDKDVVAFLNLHGLKQLPIYLTFEDHGYEADYCHVSAKHAALTKGGHRIHGWALWQFDEMVLGEFHSVWKKPDGSLVDVTPPKSGGLQVLFVPDPSLSIYDHGAVQALYCDRSSLEEFPYWWRGEPHNESEWGLPNDTPDLVRYCRKLGLPDTSMI